MPIENEIKRATPTSPKDKGGAKVEAIQNEQPPFSALAHISVDNREFVVKLCPGRHNPDKPRKAKTKVGPDGKAIKPPKPCKNDTCNIRTGLIDGLLEKTVKIKERMVAIAGQLEVVNEERQEAEVELETQQQYLHESEQRHELLVREEQECDGELARIRAAVAEGKNGVTELEAERQRLARIVFENKLKQQGVELEAFASDGLTLQPSDGGLGGVPGDYFGEPSIYDTVDRRRRKPPEWCTMEPLHLPQRTRVSRAGARGVLQRLAVHRPATCPPPASKGSATWRAWEAQAFLLPQPSLASSADDASVRRVAAAAGQRVAKLQPPTFDARRTIAAVREEHRANRSQRDEGASVYSWRDSMAMARASAPLVATSPLRPLPGAGRFGGGSSLGVTQRPGTTPARSPIGRASLGKFTAGSDTISVVTDGSQKLRGVPKLGPLAR